jgi:hypothetical protein
MQGVITWKLRLKLIGTKVYTTHLALIPNKAADYIQSSSNFVPKEGQVYIVSKSVH